MKTLDLSHGTGCNMRNKHGSVLAAAVAALLGVVTAGPAAAQGVTCETVRSLCNSIMGPECVQRLGAGSVAADAATATVCRRAARAYGRCIAAVAEGCGARDERSSELPAPAPSPVPQQPTDIAAPEQAEETSLERAPEVLSAEMKNGHLIELLGCSASGTRVECSLRVVSSEDGGRYVYRNHFEAVTPSGVPRKASRLHAAGREANSSTSFNYYQGVAYPIEVVFSGFDVESGEVMPVLSWNEERVVFRGIELE